MMDVLGLSSIFTLYQAGNGIYNLFDKVLVLDDAIAKTTLFCNGVAMEKDKRLPASSSMMVGFVDQVTTCIQRQYQILWGDKATLFIKQISAVAQALMAGSLFYNAPDTSAGLFMKSGACFFAIFFAIFFNALMSMSEA
jgi:hypothetical protein